MKVNMTGQQNEKINKMEQIWSESLRYDYALNKDSIVFDIGGFDGTWAENIHSKYLCHICIFEPVKEFYDIIKNKFQKQDYVCTYNFGLGTKDETINIGIIGSATSVFNKTGNSEQVEIKDVAPVISSFNKIDLVKINIEGAEYDLLDYIIEKRLQTKLMNIQIQFHIFEDYENRRQRIRNELSKTHHLTYDFPVGLHENWELN